MSNITLGACTLDSLAGGECAEAPAGLDAWAAYLLRWDKEAVRGGRPALARVRACVRQC